MFELAALFIISLFAGISAGYFTKNATKLMLFFIGFYVMITFILWELGVVSINISIQGVMNALQEMIPKLTSLNSKTFTDKAIVSLAGFGVGFFFGFTKIR